MKPNGNGKKSPQNHMFVMITDVVKTEVTHMNGDHFEGLRCTIRVGKFTFPNTFIWPSEDFEFHKATITRGTEIYIKGYLEKMTGNLDVSKQRTLLKKIRKGLIPYYKRMWRLPKEEELYDTIY